MAEDVVVAGVHREDRTIEPAAVELDHHLSTERAILDAGADDGDRTRLEHALERGPFVGFAAGFRHPLLLPIILPTALSFFAMLNACQPGMPLTPPPPCVAHDP